MKGMIPIWGVSAVILIIAILANMPGLTGEIFSKMIGIMFTPFFLEGSLAFLGLLAVLWVNYLRLKAQGDDFITMEINDEE